MNSAEPFKPGIWEGCVHHKIRKKFDPECNRCLWRAIQLLAERVQTWQGVATFDTDNRYELIGDDGKPVKEITDGMDNTRSS